MRYKRYPKYKKCAVEWLEEVPAHWTVSRLRHVAPFFNSNVDKKGYDGQQAVRLCNYTDVYNNEFITPSLPFMEATATEEEIRQFAVRRGDVLITKDSEDPADIGIPALIADDIPGVVCGYHLTIIRPADVITGRYLHRSIQSHPTKAHFFVEAPGITRYGLSQDAIGDTLVYLPPLSERTAISAALDRETARIDALIEKKTRFVELLKEKREALITHAVTKGLNPKAKMEDSEKEWLGNVPSHWSVAPFRAAVWYQEGPGILAVDFRERGVPLLRVSSVQQKIATLEGCNYLDPVKVSEKWEHFRVELGDLLVSASATTGKISEVDKETVGSVPYTGIIRMKAGHNVSKGYLKLFLTSGAFREQIELFKAGSTIQHYGPTHLSMMKIVLPPLEEQVDIERTISPQLCRIDELIERVAQSCALLSERRDSLITAAVTGQIDLREEAA